MATSKINSVNLLPITLQTDKNTKFLASTLDQLIQPTQLKRLDGYMDQPKLRHIILQMMSIYPEMFMI